MDLLSDIYFLGPPFHIVYLLIEWLPQGITQVEKTKKEIPQILQDLSKRKTL